MAVVPTSQRALHYRYGGADRCVPLYTNENIGGRGIGCKIGICYDSEYTNLYAPMICNDGRGVNPEQIYGRISGAARRLQSIYPTPIVYHCYGIYGAYNDWQYNCVTSIWMNNCSSMYNCIHFYAYNPYYASWDYLGTMPRCGNAITVNYYGNYHVDSHCCTRFRADVVYRCNGRDCTATYLSPWQTPIGQWGTVCTGAISNCCYWGWPL